MADADLTQDQEEGDEPSRIHTLDPRQAFLPGSPGGLKFFLWVALTHIPA